MKRWVRIAIITWSFCATINTGIAQQKEKYKSKIKGSNTYVETVSPQDILYYVNEFRRKEDLPPLTMNSTISKEAERHSYNMANERVPFGHEGFEDRVHKLMRELAPAHAAAENVAFGHLSAKKVVDLWLNSPSHRKNIEGHYNLTGIGLSQSGDGSIYFTEIFVNKD